MKDKKIGIVGLGRMGGNMARCLNDKGYNVASVFDINADVARELAEEVGANVRTKLADVTADSDIILTVVTNDKAMDAIFFGQNNLFQGAKDRVFINCATLTPAVHQKMDNAAAQVGAQCLEACMASSIPQARNGELFLMIGGSEPLFNETKPLLDDLSKALHYVGPSGKASEVKALVNMVMNINTAALAEGLGIGQALGLDLDMLCRVFSQTGANSRVLETDAADMIQRDHDCYFSAEHAAKDSGIALALAKSQGIATPLAQATFEQYTKMTEMGLGELDKSGIAELTFKGRALG
ncbi:NAD(P)-dependent oxidoreductase [Cerasicoccus arenae]|uniref:6-phosphogluconate dehydrogenase n=1 Tax=Cerasicoccus arenae TaxID=424488 RepID=A0A8J3DG67_9BACT|nr:NAD(P)-dependent oxidoreductase [Cerasicoccus arenae]MBK1857468.1 NAD(P)-dependent oxidoreductase [Cerasicoccus arenae]GHB95201.1 6-phosphogluconate dehydrogenase [Cerasicoccus arenae]